MLKNTMIKHGIGIALMVSLLGSFSALSVAKKIEPEKNTTTVVQAKDSNNSSHSERLEMIDKVNINQAGEEELTQKLNGIGKQKAKAIIEYRQKYGAFSSIENILEVQGIGPSFLEKNKDKLVL